MEWVMFVVGFVVSRLQTMCGFVHAGHNPDDDDDADADADVDADAEDDGDDK